MNKDKFIGSTLIIIGSAIGAGILALPMKIAGCGFPLATTTILLSWVVMTMTGLMVLEVNLAFPRHASSFSSMAEKLLGSSGKVVTWITYLLLLYATVAAYMAGESSLLTNLMATHLSLKLPFWVNPLIFTVTLGTAVFWGTKTVDHVNRSLISIKGFLLLATIALTLPHIDLINLFASQDLGNSKYLLAAAPVLIVIFNFHFVIPSIRIYVGDKTKDLKWIIITATTTSLTIYLIWAAATLGTVPLLGNNSFTTLAGLGHAADASDFINIITAVIHNSWVTTSINGFFNISMTTSFLGVSLGLFDFLADGFKRPNTTWGRLQTAGLTFIPPLLFTLFYPKGFIMALDYSASFIAILCIILPALMVYKLRTHPELKSPYRTWSNKFVLQLTIFIGIILSILPILTNLHLLPSII